MPARRGETPTMFEGACRAPNSFADSRHQARLVSDRRMRTPSGRHAGLRASDIPSGSIGVFSRGIGSDEYFIAHTAEVARHSSSSITTHHPDEQSAAGNSRFCGPSLFHLRVIEQSLPIFRVLSAS